MQAQLNGLFKPNYVVADRVMMHIGEAREGAMPWGSGPLAQIQDARPLQAEVGDDAAFFRQRGFVLLPHETQVEDWVTDPATPDPNCDVARLYLPEIKALIGERLLPGRRVEVWQRASLVRRGEGTGNRYALAVHQDFGLTADDYQENVVAFASAEVARLWRARYERDDVEAFMVIDFWRTIHMGEPLRSTPLALCDPHSVEAADVVPSGLLDFSPTGLPTRQLSLRYNPEQRWFFYPGMRGDEVLAFKIFHCARSDEAPRLRTCFHTAVIDPDTPPDAEPRRSCEHRVGVFLLKD